MNHRPHLIGWLVVGLLAGCSGAEPMADPNTGEVGTRGVSQIQRPMKSGTSMQPAADGSPTQQKFQLPTWPQKWEVNNREPYGVAFGVTQPGPLTVDVQSQGAPVVVELYGAAPQPVQRQTSSGTIRVTYQVTPADVQRSAFWQVRIALAQQGGAHAQAVGTIAVEHPPTDLNVLRAQVQARLAQHRIVDPQAEAAMKAKMDATFQAELAKFQQEQNARRAAITAELQPQLQAARARMQGQIKMRSVGAGDEPEQSSTSPPQEDVTGRGLLDRSQPLTVAPQGAQSFKAVLPAPEITWVSRMSGQSGDDLAVTGSNFGAESTGSRVTFFYRGSVNPAQALRYASCPSTAQVAPIKEWNDGLVVMAVPDVSGILNECPVEITLTRGSDGATSAPMYGFQLLPMMELLELPLPPPQSESYVGFPFDFTNYPFTRPPADATAPAGWTSKWGYWEVWTRLARLFDGYRGNDAFFMKKRLKNAWKVTKVEVTRTSLYCDLNPFPDGDVYITESRIGSDSPFLDVRVWMGSTCSLHYKPRIWITGPRGVPYE